MEIEFDPAKDILNIKRHGLSLSLTEELDWENADYTVDDRFFYEEIRMNVMAPLGDRLYHVTLTERGEKIRIISLRLATNKEKARYVQSYR
jgi:uncharacterized DUF497 family protein